MNSLKLMILMVGCAVAAAGCESNCSASCRSPGYYLYTPGGLPSPLVEVTADSPCMVTLFGADSGLAQVQVTDDLATQGTVCVLHGRLADGRVATANVTFGQSIGDSCCAGFQASGGEFTVSAGGTDGG